MTKDDAFCGTSVTFTVCTIFTKFWHSCSFLWIFTLLYYCIDNLSEWLVLLFQHCWVFDRVDKHCDLVVVYFIFPVKCRPVVRALPSRQFLDLISSLGMCRNFIWMLLTCHYHMSRMFTRFPGSIFLVTSHCDYCLCI